MSGAKIRGVLFEVTDSKIYCRRPLGLRIGIGVVGLVFGAACLGLLLTLWPSPASLAGRSPADLLRLNAPLLLVPLLGLCFPTALFLWMAGPADLTVDTDRRTYRFRRGFPLLASWQNGPLEDVAGLRVSALSGKSGSSHQLMLDWRNTRAAPWTLGDGAVAGRRPVQMAVSRDADRLREEAQALSRRLGVPVGEAPPAWERTRRRFQLRLTLTALALFCLISGLPGVLVGRELSTQGRDTGGTVTALRRGKGDYVRYVYQVGGRAFQGRAAVPWSLYQTLNVGDTIAVRYLPAYPHTSAMAGSRDAGSGMPLLVIGGLVLIFMLGADRLVKET